MTHPDLKPCQNGEPLEKIEVQEAEACKIQLEITQEMVNDIANRVLEEFVFEGKTIREWIRVINASKELNIIEILSKQLRRVEQERDAAVKDMKKMSSGRYRVQCGVCKHRKNGSFGRCERCMNFDSWEWCGVQEKEAAEWE